MNQEQVNELVRQVVGLFGGFVAGWGAARGWLTYDQILGILNSQTFIGLVTTGVMAIWGIVSRTNKNQVAAVAKLPEVKAVVTERTAAAADIVAKTPDNVVVAGTQEAKEKAS